MADFSIKLKSTIDTSSLQAEINSAAGKISPIKIKAQLDLTSIQQGLSGKAAFPSAVNMLLTETDLKRANQFQSSLQSLWSEGKITTETFGDATKSLSNLTSNFKEGRLSVDQMREGLDGLNQKYATFTETTEKAKKGILGMSQPLSDVIAKFTTWYIIAGLVTSAINALKSIVTITMELDKAFTSIQMVTGLNKEGIAKLRKEYIALAQEMGVTVDTVTEGADEWLRAGLEIEETTEALRASLVLSSVAQMDSAEATKYLVAIMNGYHLQANQLIKVVDKLSAVDMVAATSSQELGEALSYSANSAQLAGISLDKYIGMIATVSETTRQSASTIGNSFRSIFTRLQRVKIGTLETGESISDVDRVLKGYGIDLRKVTNNLTDMSALLDLLGEKWQEYTSAQKSEIATTIAGNYQRERFLVLMENYQKALELSQVAFESEGSAMEKYRTYLDSIEASTNSLKAAWTGFVNSLEASGIIKAVIDTLSSLLSVMNAIGGFIDKLGVLGDVIQRVLVPALVAATIAWAAFHTTATMGVAAASIAAGLAVVGGVYGIITEQINQATNASKNYENSLENLNKKTSEYEDLVQSLAFDLGEVNSAMSEKIELMEKERKVLKDQQQLQQRLLAVEKAREELANAKRQRTRVFRAGVGFTYAEDTGSVQSAQENLTKALSDLSEYKYDYALTRAKDFVQQLTDILSSDDPTMGLENLFSDFSDLADTEFGSLLNDAQGFVTEFNATLSRLNIDPQEEMANADIRSKILQQYNEIYNRYSLSADEEEKRYAKEAMDELERQYNATFKKNAKGTRNFGGGLTWVGEKGPELVNLPYGSEILSNNRSMKLHDIVSNPSSYLAGKNNGNSKIVNINGSINLPNVQNANDFINELMRIGNNSVVSFR